MNCFLSFITSLWNARNPLYQIQTNWRRETNSVSLQRWLKVCQLQKDKQKCVYLQNYTNAKNVVQISKWFEFFAACEPLLFIIIVQNDISSKITIKCTYILITNAIQFQPCMEQLLCILLKLKIDDCLYQRPYIIRCIHSHHVNKNKAAVV